MSQVIINNINGTPPYSIFVCDYYQYNCDFIEIVHDTVPPSIVITVPEKYKTVPLFIIKIIDSQNCSFIYNLSCQTPTPTPTNTQTYTQTPTQTPTNTYIPTNTPTPDTPTPTPTNTYTPTNTTTSTPTNTNTPTNTKTNTQTPTLTPTNTKTNTPTVTITPSNSQTLTPTFTPFASPTQTPTNTPTISVTPSQYSSSTFFYSFLILAEPISAATEIGNYLYSANTATTFYGFSNGVPPSTNQSTFNQQMNNYLNFLGWSNSLSPYKVFYNSNYDNSIINGPYNVNRNFHLTEITLGSVSSEAWYIILISTAFTLSNYQSIVGLGIDISDSLTPLIMNPDYYNLTVTYTGNTFISQTYRVYITYPSNDFLLNNQNHTLYFKGLGLTT